MTNELAVTLNGRTVVWDVSETIAVTMLEYLVQTFGPAKDAHAITR